jgi:Domain of unknown function (DUF4034)
MWIVRFVHSVVAMSIVAIGLLMGGSSIASADNRPVVDALLQGNPRLDELETREAIKSMVAHLFCASDFQSLEIAADQLREKKLRTSSGLSKLNFFYMAFDEVFLFAPDEEQNWLKAERLVQDWLRKYPDSTPAHLAYAKLLMQHAWAIRGGGYVDSVKPESWQPFFEYVEKARQFLQDHAALSNGDPNWDLILLEIARLQGIPDEEYLKLASAALDRNPDHYQLYFDIAYRYMPKWGGNASEIEQFARQAQERTKAIEGHALYARIYWVAAQGQYQQGLFNSSSVEWNKMKLGIDDVLKNYPDKWNIYNFAMFACFAGDKEKGRELLDRIANEEIPTSWPHVNNFDQCKNFAGLR